jgi:hypothetical protein
MERMGMEVEVSIQAVTPVSIPFPSDACKSVEVKTGKPINKKTLNRCTHNTIGSSDS